MLRKSIYAVADATYMVDELINRAINPKNYGLLLAFSAVASGCSGGSVSDMAGAAVTAGIVTGASLLSYKMLVVLPISAVVTTTEYISEKLELK